MTQQPSDAGSPVAGLHPPVGPEFFAPSWQPTVDRSALAAVLRQLERRGVPVLRDHPMAPMTTLRVGGVAAAFATLPDLPAAACFAESLAGTTAEEVPVFVLGKGSNTLVADDGFPGLVVRLGRAHKWMRRDGRLVSAGAAEAMPALAAWTAREGLSGLEFAAGVPATVGGSIRMNAGAHGSDVATRLRSVSLLLPGKPAVVQRPATEFGFGYRSSQLPARSVVVAARWELDPAAPELVRARLDELRAWRRATQPLRERNCGSVFTNPPDDSAGRWVEYAGCKGMRVGGAAVSTKHANFVTTRPGASAADVHRLIAQVRARVRAAGGPLLVPEVRLVGTFPSGPSSADHA